MNTINMQSTIQQNRTGKNGAIFFCSFTFYFIFSKPCCIQSDRKGYHLQKLFMLMFIWKTGFQFIFTFFILFTTNYFSNCQKTKREKVFYVQRNNSWSKYSNKKFMKINVCLQLFEKANKH